MINHLEANDSKCIYYYYYYFAEWPSAVSHTHYWSRSRAPDCVHNGIQCEAIQSPEGGEKKINRKINRRFDDGDDGEMLFDIKFPN